MTRSLSSTILEVDGYENVELERKLFNATQRIFKELAEEEKRGLSYAVVGGIALMAFCGEKYSPIRQNGTARDVDIIALDDPRNVIPVIRKRLLNEPFLSVDIDIAKQKKYQSLIQLLNHIKKGENGYTMVFRDIKKDLPPETMKIEELEVTTDFGPLRFKTFSPNTILHLYICRVGAIKLKDVDKIRALARKIRKNQNNKSVKTTHDKYVAFHEFASEIREKYPVYQSFIQLYNWVDKTIFNSFISHKFIPRWLFRKLINL